MSEETDEKTLVDRIELCEEGLTAVETILRATFPQFFLPEGDCNGDKETESGVKTKHQEGTGSPTEEGPKETE